MDILSGIRVLDLSMWAFCPSAGAILASWGADVIHIENPAAPDPMRVFAGGGAGPGEAHWMFKHYNRGKRAMTLNLADERGRQILYDLIDSADVFLTSYLGETRQKLGIDVDDVQARNSHIVYAKGTGAGPNGPEAHRGGYDAASWWSRGSLAATSMAVAGVDYPPGMIGHGDGMSGLVFAGGICAALLKRERTGVASVVDSSLMGTAMWFNAPAITSSTFPPAQQFFNAKADRMALAWSGNFYRTADHRYLYLSLLGDSQADWTDFCPHLGRPDLVQDPRFATTALRIEHNVELIQELDKVFAERSYAQWCEALLTTRGVWAPVQTPIEMHDDVQAKANRFIQQVEYPGGAIPLVTPPILFDSDAGDIQRAPDFGEHTDEVLGEAGFDAGSIGDLRAAGVIR